METVCYSRRKAALHRCLPWSSPPKSHLRAGSDLPYWCLPWRPDCRPAQVRDEVVPRIDPKLQDLLSLCGMYGSGFDQQKEADSSQVPPIIINMLRNKDQCAKYDLSSVSSLYTGAAPLGPETVDEYLKVYPTVAIKQAYGLTETSTVVCSTHPEDFLLGSSGCLMPGAEVRILSPEGQEIKAYDTPGELVVRSPSVVLGYLNNDKATKETFRDGWMYTGDEAVIRQNPKTKSEHIFIVDRIKELIKVKVCAYREINYEVEQQLTVHRACKSPPPS